MSYARFSWINSHCLNCDKGCAGDRENSWAPCERDCPSTIGTLRVDEIMRGPHAEAWARKYPDAAKLWRQRHGGQP